VRRSKLWKKLLDVEHVVLGDEVLEAGPGGTEILVIRLRPDKRHWLRCPLCGCRRPHRDDGEGRRRWRALDMAVGVLPGGGRAAGGLPAARVIVAAVPWARHDSRYTCAFEDYAAWLAAGDAGKEGRQAAADHVAVPAVDRGAGGRGPGRANGPAGWAEADRDR
jgi:transposase